MKKYIASSLLSIVMFPAFAQEMLNLKECIAIGLEKNYDIRIVRNEERILDNNVTIGNAGFLPNLSLSTGYNATSTSTTQFPADGSDKIESGAVTNQSANAGVNLNWTLFDGFGMQTSFKRLKELQSMGELNTRLTIENFVANIAAEYYNFVQQQNRMKNLKSAVSLSKERLRIVEARYQIGSLSRLDLQQARVDFNADSSRLIKQYEVLYASHVKLNQMMGNDDVEKQINISDSEIIFDDLLSKEQLWSDTQLLNTLLMLSEKDKSLSILNLKAEQSQNFPYLRLNGGYGLNYNIYGAGNFSKQQSYGPNVGITIGYTLFDGFERRRRQKNARIQIENSKLEYEQLQQSVSANFANIWMAYRNNIELVLLEKENLKHARENYEIALERYKLGDLAGILLREAQNSLLEAEERLIVAQYNTKLCEISLLQISGRVGEYYSQ